MVKDGNSSFDLNEKLVCYHIGPTHNSVMLAAGLATLPSEPVRLRLLAGCLELSEQRFGAHSHCLYQLSSDHPPFLLQVDCRYTILSVTDDMRCQLEFYCAIEDYTKKKYGLTRTHSAVIEAAPLVPRGSVLDLGCGRGRNALYLHKLGHKLTCLDRCRLSVDQLKKRVIEEGLTNFYADYYDINHASLHGDYDFIVSTVVMMFLDPDRIRAVIKNMQSITKQGGFNLIVSAMSTLDCPCTVPFPFTFSTGELKHYYQGWHIKKYNENRGELHRRDHTGGRIKLRFATLLAEKPVC